MDKHLHCTHYSSGTMVFLILIHVVVKVTIVEASGRVGGRVETYRNGKRWVVCWTGGHEDPKFSPVSFNYTD